MNAELMSIAAELNRRQTAAGRCELLAGLGRGDLEALRAHYAEYDPRLFPDGRVNGIFINAALLSLSHRQQSLAVIADFQAVQP